MRRLSTLSLQARLSGLFLAVGEFSSKQFWGGHPNTFRSFFAWASLSIAYYFFTEKRAFDAHGYELMRVIATSELWAAAFAVHWLCISLVVLTARTKRPVRIQMQLVVNCYGTFVWSFYVVLQDLAFQHMAINASAERVMVLYSVWALIRTGMNRHTDRRKN